MLVLLAIAAVKQTAREAMKIHVKHALGGFEALVLALDFIFSSWTKFVLSSPIFFFSKPNKRLERAQISI